MAVIELRTFRLSDDGSEGAFLEADARAQTEFAYQQPGLVRRTTAQSGDGEWLVVTVWSSQDDAERAETRAPHHPAVQALRALVDADGASVRRYQTLD
jgi:heme-degrading monooxygenase HmoA